MASNEPGMGGWSDRAFTKTDGGDLMPENVPDTSKGRMTVMPFSQKLDDGKVTP